jgi:flagellar hook-associated protein 2
MATNSITSVGSSLSNSNPFATQSTVTSIGSASSNVSSTASSLAISGLASGMNWTSVVQELGNAERAPETQWQNQQTTIAAQNAAYTTIQTDLQGLQTDAQTLLDPSFFSSVVGSSSSPSVASASAASGTPIGNFSFNISQLATAAQVNGAAGVSQKLVPDGIPADVTIGIAGFSAAVTDGTFTVNGAQVPISSSDSLQQVFNNIASATNNAVTASYDSTTDTIKLTGSSTITLGSATDTSNFLQVAQLYNNNGGTSNNTGIITSTSALGHAKLSATLANAGLNTTISDGGGGNGAFKINGVTINYNATTDSLQDVLNNINESGAGVSASYDPVNNRFVLANSTTGDMGIAMQDLPGQGNFLAATGLSSGTLANGKNLLYTLNGGSQQLISQSNTIASSSSGVQGLTVSALTTGTTTVNVAADTGTMSTAIQKFVTDYNSIQSFITSQQAVTTAADGTVTPGTLTGDTNTNSISTSLRSMMSSVENIAGTSGAVQGLSDLGFQSNGNNNTIALSNSNTLTSALTSNLSDVKALFSNATSGLGVQINTFVNATIGTGGTLTTREADLTQQNTDISTQISNLETKISNDTNQWNAEFQAMETAESQTNQELTYLSQAVTNGSL